MLVSFAYRFRQRPSGTGNNEPPASLNSAAADLTRNPEAVNSEPARQATLHIPHAGLKEETAT